MYYTELKAVLPPPIKSHDSRLPAGLPYLGPDGFRLAPNGTNPNFFISDFSTFKLANVLKYYLKKSGFGTI